jgi:glutaredoxin 3
MRYLTTLALTLVTVFSPIYASVQSEKPLTKVEIYTIPGCMGCNLAKGMFDDRKIPYQEISLQGRRDLYAEMKRRVGGDQESTMTVPRIFINGKYIGGYSELNGGDLDKLVSANKPTATGPSNNAQG